MLPIHDGVRPVRRITVLSLVRDNEQWLEYATQAFSAMERKYDVEFSYHFFENDSVDRTAEIVRAFLVGRKGTLVQDSLPPFERAPDEQPDLCYGRISRLAGLRNRLLDSVRPLDSDWTLMVDSDVMFSTDTLARMFSIEPARNGIVMVTPYSQQVHRTPDGATLTQMHYYDTYAFVNAQDRCYWPKCDFERCVACQGSIPVGQAVIDVRCAFGGFALVESAALNDRRVRWRPLGAPGRVTVCEHVAFCDALRVVTEKRVVVAQQASDVYWFI